MTLRTSLLLLGLGCLAACSGSPSASTSATAALTLPPIDPNLTPVLSLSTSEPRAAASTLSASEATPSAALPNLTRTSMPMATATPTPPPLPQVCLRQQFADDVEACHQAPSYSIDLSVEPASAQVSGHQQITYTNAEGEPLDTFYLRLLPNTPGYGGTMTVTDLLKSGQPITPHLELEDTALRLPLDPPLKPGRMFTLTLDYKVDVPHTEISGHGLFSYIQGVMALPTVYALIPVYDDQGWNVEIAPEYADDVFADVALYTAKVRAPPEFTLISTGSCATPEAGTWICDAAPMRDFTVVLGKDYVRAGRKVNGIVVNSYYYPWHEAGGGKALDVAVDAMEVFSDLFGPYPYAELDVVETPNYLGGMEYSGLVVVEDRLYPGVAGVEWLTAHEVAHQWWMVVVGNDQIDEPWLDEALTQYSTLLYYENVYGEQRAQGILHGEFIQSHQSLQRRGRDMPAGLPAASYAPDVYWDVVYDKGALYFSVLRQRVGDEAFFDILQTYYSRHRYEIATSESFLKSIEDVTGDAHRDLYEKWIGGQSEQ